MPSGMGGRQHQTVRAVLCSGRHGFREAKAWFDEHRDDEGAIVFEGSEEVAD
jgi:hypothetical protein